MTKEKSPWGKLKKGEAAKMKRIASSGMAGGKVKKLKWPK